MLAKAGLDEDALACGAHWPLNADAARALARRADTPSALHNNCSGKHAGFLCMACALRLADSGLRNAPNTAYSATVKAALEEVCGERLDESRRGSDGCSIPTYAIALTSLARGFARLGSGHGLGPARAAAAKTAVLGHGGASVYVAGTGRFDAEAMTCSRAGDHQDRRRGRVLREPPRTRSRASR